MSIDGARERVELSRHLTVWA